MKDEQSLERYIKNIEVASQIISFYEKKQVSLRNAMKMYQNFSKDDDRHSYSQVHALVFETVRYQNICNRIIHQQIQSQLNEKLNENIRNILRVVVYLAILAPENQQEQYWVQAYTEILKSLDLKYSKPGKPGIVFDEEMCAKAWRGDWQVGLYGPPRFKKYVGRQGTEMFFGLARRKALEKKNKTLLRESYIDKLDFIGKNVNGTINV